MKIITPIKFRQPTSGWCGVYNLANIYNDERALDFIKEERFKGCTPTDEKEILEYIGQNTWIEPLMTVTQDLLSPPLPYVYNVIQKFYSLQKEFLDSLSENLLPFIPIFLSVRLTEITPLWHRTSIVMYKDRMFYIDSMKENIIEIENPTDMGLLFFGCNYVETLASEADGEKRYNLLFGEVFGHHWLGNV